MKAGSGFETFAFMAVDEAAYEAATAMFTPEGFPAA
jgi:hypothetical protein